MTALQRCGLALSLHFRAHVTVLTSRLLCDLPVELMLGDESGLAWISGRQTLSVTSVPADNPLAGPVVIIPLLVVLIGVDDTLNTSLTVLAHRDELLIGVPGIVVRTALLMTMFQPQHLSGLDFKFLPHLSVSFPNLTQPLEFFVLTFLIVSTLPPNSQLLLRFSATAVTIH